MAHDEPMTGERLAEMRRWSEVNNGYMAADGVWVGELLAEVECLRAALEHAEQQARIALKMVSLAVDAKKRSEAENADMRPIVAAVATPRPKNVCGLCTYPYASAHGKERQHTPDCPVVAARSYVAAHPATGEGE
jgi:hypothetical protein